MANINGNNIDDLFRQASDQYPLRTDSSDWDKLASALEADPSLISPPVFEQEDKRRRRRFLWLLLLLPLGGLGYYAMQSEIHTRPGMDMANAKRTNVDSKEIDTRTVADTKVAATDTRTTGTETRTGTSAETAGATKQEAAETAETGKSVKPAAVRSATSVMSAGKGPDQRPGITGINGKTRVNRTIGGDAKSGNAGTGAGNRTQGNHLAGNKTAGKDITGNPQLNTQHDTPQHDTPQQDPAFSRVSRPAANAAGDISVIADVRSKTGETPGQASAGPLKKASPDKERHSIYVGILGAPDLSTIHMQSVKSVGTTFGILGGYSFNPKWSVETGVYLDMKRYYTEGQYFSKKKVQALRYVNLLDVNGTCNMVEIPVNLRYNLSSGKSRKWFATAGLSTYLMSKEWYDYHYLSYGTAMDNAFTYKKPYHYLFSILNMSLGYEQKLGRIGNLRLEPYLRVPLSGIGTGSLSIMSAGLNVGITRRIW